MDKYEYQVCLQEIDTLIQEQDFQSAADIADTIDWKRVKSVITLCRISDLYKINGRYEDARDLLLLAYDRNPSGRQIVSSLCTLELKLDHYLYALKYYNTFVQLAPRDPERYVLQYRMYQAQNVSLIEQIEVLETLKQADYRERWGYELANLYYQQGNYSAAVRECDELAATFGDGKYVRKAKVLKASITGGPVPVEEPAPAPAEHGYAEYPAEPSYEYRPADDGYGAGTEESYENGYGYPEDASYAAYPEDGSYPEDAEYPEEYPAEAAGPEEVDDVTRIYSTGRDSSFATGARPAMIPGSARPERADAVKAAAPAAPAKATETVPGTEAENVKAAESAPAEKAPAAETASESEIGTDFSTQALRDAVAEGLEAIDGKYESRLSQESSGQYGMVLEEQPAPEKQITGQMYLYGMAGWQKTKNEMEQRFMDETRRRISENTGSLLRNFEETSRQGYLEELEQDLDREEIEAAAESVIPDGMELSDGMTPQARYRAALARGEADPGYDSYGYDGEAYNEDGYADEYPEEYPTEEYPADDHPVEEVQAESVSAPETEAVAAPAEAATAAAVAAAPAAGAAPAAEEDKETPAAETVDAKDDEDPEATKAWSYKEVRTLEQEAALQTAISESRRKQKEQQLREERERRQSEQRMERSELDRQKAEVERRMAELDRERAELMREKAEQERELAKQRDEILEQARKDAAQAVQTMQAPAAAAEEAAEAAGTVEAAASAAEAVAVTAEAVAVTAEAAATAEAAVTAAAPGHEESLDEEIRAQVEAEGRQRLEDSRPMGRIPAETIEAAEAAAPAAGVHIVDGPVHPVPGHAAEAEEAVEETAEVTAEPVETVPGKTPEQAEEEQRIREHEERRRRAEAARRAYTPREMTDGERQMFTAFLSDERTAGQITYALDTMSLAAYTGNIVIAGSSREASMNLAKAFIRYMRSQDSNFSGKVAHSTGEVINRKDLIKALHSIENGALIVEGAGAMSDDSIRNLCTGLDREDKGLLVILIDSVKKISQMFGRVPALEDAFNVRVDLVPMNNDALVADAVRYAEASGYSIDEFGVLALHTRIAGMQTIDHTVTVDEVRDIVDEAISYADKKTPGRLMGRMFGKRYDDNRRVILREKDFQHNS